MSVRDALGFGTQHRGMLRLVMISVAWWSAGCKSEAVAVEQCREIEHTRCEASVACGELARDEVGECKRVYDDQCLHGIAGPEAPTARQQDRCVSLIEAAGETARSSPEGDEDFDQACDVIGSPWDYGACDFLNPAQGGAGGEDDD